MKNQSLCNKIFIHFSPTMLQLIKSYKMKHGTKIMCVHPGEVDWMEWLFQLSSVHGKSPKTGSAWLLRVMWHGGVISEAIVNIPSPLSRLLNECLGKSRNSDIDNSLHNITLIINGHVVNDKGPINFYWSQGLAIEKLYYIIPPPRWWWPHHQTSLRWVKSEPKGLKFPKWISHSIVPLFHTN